MAKFNVNFSDSTYAVVSELSQRLGVPMADVIRDALSLQWWLAKEVMAGNKLLIERGDRITEVIIPSLEPLAGGPTTASVVKKERRQVQGQESPKAATA